MSDMPNKTLLTDLHRFDHSPLNKIFEELAEKFLTEETVREVVDFYGDDKIKCNVTVVNWNLSSAQSLTPHL